jgi:2'-5' RNA ligase
MEKTLSRYFIAIVPPEPIYEEIDKLKRFGFEKFGTKGALRSPPHITLHMPFLWKAEKENRLIDGLTAFCKTQAAFDLMTNGFACFAPRVIFIAIGENNLLGDLQRKLVKFCRSEFKLLNANYRELPFHPHITIAFRDLKKAQFIEAWQEFQNKTFHSQFEVRTIALLRHDGSRWHVLCECPLKK